jgi:hypothetical protein
LNFNSTPHIYYPLLQVRGRVKVRLVVKVTVRVVVRVIGKKITAIETTLALAPTLTLKP